MGVRGRGKTKGQKEYRNPTVVLEVPYNRKMRASNAIEIPVLFLKLHTSDKDHSLAQHTASNSDDSTCSCTR